jgi:indole-3-glycerol phosphate synthase
VQAFVAWTPPTGVLGGLVREARERAKRLRGALAELERRAAAVPAAPGLAVALARPDVAVIAEVKRRSPSGGWIKPALSAANQARAYAEGGAAAISVLTEIDHFGGSPEDLEKVRSAVRIPALKKDFHVDPVQLVEAKALGASAALLIVRALSPENLGDMLQAAARLDLEVLVEVHDETELERAIEAGARLLGINNRDLETLDVDPTTSERLVGRVPRGLLAVAESGIAERGDVERLARFGTDAVLVGTAVSAAEDPAAAVRALTGAPRAPRHG